MAAPGLSLLAAMLLGFPRSAVWEPPKPAPAPIQRLPGFGRDTRGVGQLEHQVHQDIDAGRRSGELSRSQARSFRRQADYVEALERRYSQDGLSASESVELQNRLEALHSVILATGSGGTASAKR